LFAREFREIAGLREVWRQSLEKVSQFVLCVDNDGYDASLEMRRISAHSLITRARARPDSRDRRILWKLSQSPDRIGWSPEPWSQFPVGD